MLVPKALASSDPPGVRLGVCSTLLHRRSTRGLDRGRLTRWGLDVRLDREHPSFNRVWQMPALIARFRTKVRKTGQKHLDLDPGRTHTRRGPSGVPQPLRVDVCVCLSRCCPPAPRRPPRGSFALAILSPAESEIEVVEELSKRAPTPVVGGLCRSSVNEPARTEDRGCAWRVARGESPPKNIDPPEVSGRNAAWRIVRLEVAPDRSNTGQV